jgi:hypothetical protein
MVGSSAVRKHLSNGLHKDYAAATPRRKEALFVARKSVLISDQSGKEIPEGKGAKVRITFLDARRGVRELDLTDEEAEALGGRPVARRGRRPKSS